MLASKALAAAVSQEPVYIEDVFSTYLYTGNSSTQTITNGIDLAGEGGMTWFKNRTTGGSAYHTLFDTERGNTKGLHTSLTVQQIDYTGFCPTFLSSGFSIEGNSEITNGAFPYVSWTFRKAEKFFDVVTFTTDASGQATFSHGLGSIPGFVIFKRTDDASAWYCYHRSLTSTSYFVSLNTTGAQVNAGAGALWSFTDTSASVGVSAGTPFAANAQHVAYLFAHDAGGFGADGSENVISCGSYVGNGTASGPVVTLGYEPQWLLIKNASSSADWVQFDNMRGLPNGSVSASPILNPNTSNAEGVSAVGMTLTPTGFFAASGSGSVNSSGNTFIYIAIRRGPMKVPESGTEVYQAVTRSGTGGDTTVTGASFPPDAAWSMDRGGIYGAAFFDRLRGVGNYLRPITTNAEVVNATTLTSFNMDGVSYGSNNLTNYSLTTFVDQWFRRAPGFFDVVCDTGTGAAHTVSHNLGVTPELMIRKKRSAADNWVVYAGDATDYLILNSTAATADLDTMWNDTAPTASVFTVGTNDDVNQSTGTFVTYLFATLAGVSKVGSYTGNGSSQTINCGFTGGARFVLIKRTDSTGDWYVWDSARGIVAGNDPYILLNSAAAEVTSTDYVDTYSAGFELSSTAPAAINANGGTFIFLAIA